MTRHSLSGCLRDDYVSNIPVVVPLCQLLLREPRGNFGHSSRGRLNNGS